MHKIKLVIIDYTTYHQLDLQLQVSDCKLTQIIHRQATYNTGTWQAVQFCDFVLGFVQSTYFILFRKSSQRQFGGLS